MSKIAQLQKELEAESARKQAEIEDRKIAHHQKTREFVLFRFKFLFFSIK